MKEALCRVAAIQPGGYRTAVQLWIAPSGAVVKAALLSSNGSDDRDANGTPQEDMRRKKNPGQQSYDTHSAVQIVGYGGLTARQQQSLTAEEKRRLWQP